MRSRSCVAVVVIAGWLGGCAVGAPELVDIATLERPARPNIYLVCPASRTSARVDREPESYALATDVLWQLWVDALASEPRVETQIRDNERRRLLLVQRTPLLRFPDLIQLEVYPALADGSTLCVYSRSIYGYSDFGANRARVEDWLARIRP